MELPGGIQEDITCKCSRATQTENADNIETPQATEAEATALEATEPEHPRVEEPSSETLSIDPRDDEPFYQRRIKRKRSASEPDSIAKVLCLSRQHSLVTDTPTSPLVELTTTTSSSLTTGQEELHTKPPLIEAEQEITGVKKIASDVPCEVSTTELQTPPQPAEEVVVHVQLNLQNNKLKRKLTEKEDKNEDIRDVKAQFDQTPRVDSFIQPPYTPLILLPVLPPPQSDLPIGVEDSQAVNDPTVLSSELLTPHNAPPSNLDTSTQFLPFTLPLASLMPDNVSDALPPLSRDVTTAATLTQDTSALMSCTLSRCSLEKQSSKSQPSESSSAPLSRSLSTSTSFLEELRASASQTPGTSFQNTSSTRTLSSQEELTSITPETSSAIISCTISIASFELTTSTSWASDSSTDNTSSTISLSSPDELITSSSVPTSDENTPLSLDELPLFVSTTENSPQPEHDTNNTSSTSASTSLTASTMEFNITKLLSTPDLVTETIALTLENTPPSVTQPVMSNNENIQQINVTQLESATAPPLSLEVESQPIFKIPELPRLLPSGDVSNIPLPLPVPTQPSQLQIPFAPVAPFRQIIPAPPRQNNNTHYNKSCYPPLPRYSPPDDQDDQRLHGVSLSLLFSPPPPPPPMTPPLPSTLLSSLELTSLHERISICSDQSVALPFVHEEQNVLSENDNSLTTKSFDHLTSTSNQSSGRPEIAPSQASFSEVISSISLAYELELKTFSDNININTSPVFQQNLTRSSSPTLDQEVETPSVLVEEIMSPSTASQTADLLTPMDHTDTATAGEFQQVESSPVLARTDLTSETSTTIGINISPSTLGEQNWIRPQSQFLSSSSTLDQELEAPSALVEEIMSPSADAQTADLTRDQGDISTAAEVQQVESYLTLTHTVVSTPEPGITVDEVNNVKKTGEFLTLTQQCLRLLQRQFLSPSRTLDPEVEAPSAEVQTNTSPSTDVQIADPITALDQNSNTNISITLDQEVKAPSALVEEIMSPSAVFQTADPLTPMDHTDMATAGEFQQVESSPVLAQTDLTSETSTTIGIDISPEFSTQGEQNLIRPQSQFLSSSSTLDQKVETPSALVEEIISLSAVFQTADPLTPMDHTDMATAGEFQQVESPPVLAQTDLTSETSTTIGINISPEISTQGEQNLIRPQSQFLSSSSSLDQEVEAPSALVEKIMSPSTVSQTADSLTLMDHTDMTTAGKFQQVESSPVLAQTDLTSETSTTIGINISPEFSAQGEQNLIGPQSQFLSSSSTLDQVVEAPSALVEEIMSPSTVSQTADPLTPMDHTDMATAGEFQQVESPPVLAQKDLTSETSTTIGINISPEISTQGEQNLIRPQSQFLSTSSTLNQEVEAPSALVEEIMSLSAVFQTADPLMPMDHTDMATAGEFQQVESSPGLAQTDLTSEISTTIGIDISPEFSAQGEQNLIRSQSQFLSSSSTLDQEVEAPSALVEEIMSPSADAQTADLIRDQGDISTAAEVQQVESYLTLTHTVVSTPEPGITVNEVDNVKNTGEVLTLTQQCFLLLRRQFLSQSRTLDPEVIAPSAVVQTNTSPFTDAQIADPITALDQNSNTNISITAEVQQVESSPTISQIDVLTSEPSNVIEALCSASTSTFVAENKNNKLKVLSSIHLKNEMLSLPQEEIPPCTACTGLSGLYVTESPIRIKLCSITKQANWTTPDPKLDSPMSFDTSTQTSITESRGESTQTEWNIPIAANTVQLDSTQGRNEEYTKESVIPPDSPVSQAHLNDNISILSLPLQLEQLASPSLQFVHENMAAETSLSLALPEPLNSSLCIIIDPPDLTNPANGLAELFVPSFGLSPVPSPMHPPSQPDSPLPSPLPPPSTPPIMHRIALLSPNLPHACYEPVQDVSINIINSFEASTPTTSDSHLLQSNSTPNLQDATTQQSREVLPDDLYKVIDKITRALDPNRMSVSQIDNQDTACTNELEIEFSHNSLPDSSDIGNLVSGNDNPPIVQETHCSQPELIENVSHPLTGLSTSGTQNVPFDASTYVLGRHSAYSLVEEDRSLLSLLFEANLPGLDTQPTPSSSSQSFEPIEETATFQDTASSGFHVTGHTQPDLHKLGQQTSSPPVDPSYQEQHSCSSQFKKELNRPSHLAANRQNESQTIIGSPLVFPQYYQQRRSFLRPPPSLLPLVSAPEIVDSFLQVLPLVSPQPRLTQGLIQRFLQTVTPAPPSANAPAELPVLVLSFLQSLPDSLPPPPMVPPIFYNPEYSELLISSLTNDFAKLWHSEGLTRYVLRPNTETQFNYFKLSGDHSGVDEGWENTFGNTFTNSSFLFSREDIERFRSRRFFPSGNDTLLTFQQIARRIVQSLTSFSPVMYLAFILIFLLILGLYFM